jgi:hypothetical protein
MTRSDARMDTAYSPPTASFTRQEVATINPSLYHGVHMPLADVVFGPAYLGGIGLRHLDPEQGSLKNSALLDHDQLGQMI